MISTERKTELLALAGITPEPEGMEDALELSTASPSPMTRARKRQLLDLAGIRPSKPSAPIQKIVDEHVASARWPASHRDYLDAESALRQACTAETRGGGKKLDRDAFHGALYAWCNQTGYPMPAGAE